MGGCFPTFTIGLTFLFIYFYLSSTFPGFELEWLLMMWIKLMVSWRQRFCYPYISLDWLFSPSFQLKKIKRIGNKILMIREKSWPWPQIRHYPNHGQLTITNHYNLAQRSHQRLTNQVVVVQSRFWDPQNQALGLLPWAPMHMRNQTFGHHGGP